MVCKNTKLLELDLLKKVLISINLSIMCYIYLFGDKHETQIKFRY